MDESVAITTSAATTGTVAFKNHRAGTVYIPAGSDITSLTFHVAPKPGGTFVPLYAATVAVALTVVHTRAYALPAALAGCKAFRMVGSHAGTVHISFQE